MMPLFHELEEDVGLFRFNVDIPQLVQLCGAQRNSIHVAKSVMLTMALPAPLGRAKTTSLRNITFAIRRSVIPQTIQDL
jgi:hypothetical protein